MPSNPRSRRFKAIGTAALLAAFGLAGCTTTMSVDDCRGADWYALGVSDAKYGRMSSYGSDRLKTCAEHGVRGEIDDWMRGWEVGRRQICAPGSAAGWAELSSGYTRGFCPPDMEPAFLAAYTPARERYLFEKKVRDLQQRMDDRSRQLADINRDMGSQINQTAQRQSELRGRRAALEVEINNLRDQIRTESLIRMVR
jgi:hypothetical protein